METIQECHRRLAAILGSEAEPVEVLLRAEEHRHYWRPDRVKVVLLAESHVYTTLEELGRTVSFPMSVPADLPRGFVRLVYCLGYGENRLLSRPITTPRNTGTPQFWKIFYSCVHPIAANGDFAPVQTSTTSPAERIANKIALLQRMRDLGVWLLDTSLAALYLPGRHRPGPATLETCLQTSWDCYVRYAVEAAAPSHVVCIGRGVARALGRRLPDLGVRVTVVPQPNARLSSTDHHASFKTYYDAVSVANELA
jgi:hypothetical protein